ncbi:hypothetical protein [Sphingomonas faeni]|uniref:hypothetical protein n=1 Tax=Sphingomonas faeni TaxID=185950 RepID=UPI003355475C
MGDALIRRLLTAEEVVQEFGLPSIRTLRTMRQKGLPGVRLGKAFMYRADDIEQHIEKVRTCPAPTVAPRSSGLRSARRSISSGTRADANVSVRLALQTAERLKKSSKTSSANVGEQSNQTGHVVPIR